MGLKQLPIVPNAPEAICTMRNCSACIYPCVKVGLWTSVLFFFHRSLSKMQLMSEFGVVCNLFCPDIRVKHQTTNIPLFCN